ncbi:MAG: hypothetical protein LBL49_05750 [Clostridiales Family XIII bacterium]|jgi:hypothetical protein|nr:hypothetical protein [Clostridiales Family XIII bacterium]
MSVRICEKCAGVISEGDLYCAACGAEVKPNFAGQAPGEYPGGAYQSAGHQPGVYPGDAYQPAGQQPGVYPGGAYQHAGQQPGGSQVGGYQDVYNYGAPQWVEPQMYTYVDPPFIQRPIKVSSYIGHILLYCIGIIGLIFAIIFMNDSSKSQNFRNFSKAMLFISIAIVGIGVLYTVLVFWFTFSTLDYYGALF